MKKCFIVTAAILMTVGYLIIPAGTPIEEVRCWMGAELMVFAVLWFLFRSFGWDKNVN